MELLDQRLALELDLLAQLLDRDVRAVRACICATSASRSHSSANSRVGVRRRRRLDHLVDPLADLLGEVVALEHAAPLRVDHLALHVHHVVVLEDVLARDEVLLLDLLLRALDLVREDLRLHRLVVRELEALHDVEDPVAGEQAHEVVLAGEVEARLAGVALAAGAAAQLVVDPARLVPLGGEHVEAAELDDALAELDVDAAAGHVRRDRDRAGLAGVLDDLGLALVLLRVQHVVRDPRAASAARERYSEVSTAIVPTRTGWPFSWRSLMSSITAANFASFVLKMKSFSSRARPGRSSGSRRRGGRRSRRTPSPRSWPYRSCRRASRRGGSSSGA